MKKKNNILAKEDKIKKRLKKLSLIINKHNILYHQKDKPEITDQEFDKYVIENNHLESLYPHLVLKNSPNKFVGSKIANKFKKIIHKSPMLSLANAFNENNIEDFIDRIKKYLNIDSKVKIDFLCEPKIDGLSLNLNYKNGKLYSASTRGDGKIGEDVTQNISNVIGIPSVLDNKKFSHEIEIRGEIFLNKKDFI